MRRTWPLPNNSYASFSSGIGGWFPATDLALVSRNFEPEDLEADGTPIIGNSHDAALYLADVHSIWEEILHRLVFLPTTVRFILAWLETISNYHFVNLIEESRRFTNKDSDFVLSVPLNLNLGRSTTPDVIRDEISYLYRLSRIAESYHRACEPLVEGSALYMLTRHTTLPLEVESLGLKVKSWRKRLREMAFATYPQMRGVYPQIQRALSRMVDLRSVTNYGSPNHASMGLLQHILNVPLPDLPYVHRTYIWHLKKSLQEYPDGVSVIEANIDLDAGLDRHSVDPLIKLTSQARHLRTRISRSLGLISRSSETELKRFLQSSPLREYFARKIQEEVELPPMPLPELYDLELWCRALAEALGEHRYLVASINKPMNCWSFFADKLDPLPEAYRLVGILDSSSSYLWMLRSGLIRLSHNEVISASDSKELWRCNVTSIMRNALMKDYTRDCPFRNWIAFTHESCFMGTKSDSKGMDTSCPSHVLGLDEVRISFNQKAS